MSDTLRERLRRMKYTLDAAGYSDAAVADDLITELDRLEAEVKKPRLPEGWQVEKIGMDGRELIGIQHDDDERHGGFWLDQIKTKRDSAFVDFLSAFLPTPDVVPSTEPVQAAGDTASVSDRTLWPDKQPAEKPKPVSLDSFDIRLQGLDIAVKNLSARVRDLERWIPSTLDQERGV